MTEGNSTPMFMPVAPAYGGYGNNGFGDGNGAWWILILLLALGGGWGGMGFGGNGGGFVNADIQRGFDQNAVMTGVAGVQNTLTSGFGDLQTALCGGFAGVNSNIMNGFAQAEIGENARQMANMQQSFGISNQLSQCCCENRLATSQTQNIVQAEGAATRSAIQQQTQAILDKMCQDKIDAKNEKIVELNNRINFLEENNYVQNALTAQTQFLLNRLTTTTPTAPGA